MINQISPVQNKTESLPKINKALIQARHIQTQVKERVGGLAWSPIPALPYFVSRRVE
jgi:hypothetical protein